MTKEIQDLSAKVEINSQVTNEKLNNLESAIVKMSESFDKWLAHVAVYEEDKKHDAEFKKEVREHMKKADPLLSYVDELKKITSKMKMAFFVAIMFAVLALLGFNIK